MPLYICECCRFESKLKGDYNRHLKTKKHLNNYEKFQTNQPFIPKMSTNEHKMSTNEHKMSTNEHKMSTDKLNNSSEFVCEYCDAKFASKPNMRRHQLHYCKNAELNCSLKTQLKKEKREKKQLYKQIEKFLEHNGTIMNNSHNNINNTTNNTNNIQQHNNIVINNYGEEDLSHITHSVLDKLITAPGDMINNLTKMIHFNNNKPENMNMYIPSRKQKFIKVFRKNQWMLEKKHERIPDLVDRNYNIIDTYYEDHGGVDNVSRKTKKNYEQYQKLIDDKNDKVIKKEYDSCELEILNNSQVVIDKHNLNN